MEILVSFCNVSVPGRPALGLLDTATSSFRVLQLPRKLPQPVSVAGLGASRDYLYAALPESPPAPSELLILERGELAVRNHYVFRSALDVHSLLVSGDALFVVSTGTDEVIELRLRGCEVLSETVRWRPEPGAPRADNHHLNALCEWRGELLVSGHGKKTADRWSSARGGFIVNINRGEQMAQNIHHPHSLVPVGDTLAYCESSTMAVRLLGDVRAQRLPGYARGLCLAGGKLFVGTSIGRRVSKSTGVINNPAESGVPAGRCTCSRLAPDTFAVEETVDLSSYGTEIYDLLPVEGAARWPSAPEGAARIVDPVEELATCIPPGDTFILVDDEQWGTGPSVAGRRRLPFLEKDGEYWGPPDNDATAVREMERLRRTGARFIAFAWPSFWWLDYYRGFHQHLRSNFPCVLKDDLLIIFDIRKVSWPPPESA